MEKGMGDVDCDGSTYGEGRIHLKESPAGIREARVRVTFLEESRDSVPSGLRGLSPQQRATRLAALQATWAERLSPSDTFARDKAAPTNGAPPH
jgi:hypothetical protein